MRAYSEEEFLAVMKAGKVMTEYHPFYMYRNHRVKSVDISHDQFTYYTVEFVKTSNGWKFMSIVLSW